MEIRARGALHAVRRLEVLDATASMQFGPESTADWVPASGAGQTA